MMLGFDWPEGAKKIGIMFIVPLLRKCHKNKSQKFDMDTIVMFLTLECKKHVGKFFVVLVSRKKVDNNIYLDLVVFWFDKYSSFEKSTNQPNPIQSNPNQSTSFKR